VTPRAEGRAAGQTAVRGVILLGAVVVAALFVLEMSGSARRTLSTNGIQRPTFVAPMPRGGILCQPGLSLPTGARYAQVYVGSYRRPLPAVDLSFRNPAGTLLASGRLPAGHPELNVDVPMTTRSGATQGTLCLRFETRRALVFGGVPGAAGAGSAQVNGKAVNGAIEVAFLSSRQSWWGALGHLSDSFGYGKAGWIGSLTLPLVALVMLAVWIGTLALLWRRFRT
jgi:hypothetical protein